MIVRGIEAICCCFSFNRKAADTIEMEANTNGLKIKASLLDTLWKLGLPENSRKTLWPLVIGNNLSYTPSMIEEVKKRMKKTDEFAKIVSFNPGVV